MMVSSTQSPDEETEKMIIQRHTKFLSLPERTRDKLASIKTSQKIQLIGQKYQFELLRLANITRLIREYYFGEIRLEDFAAEIEKRMGVSLLTAQEITRYIKQEIIDWDPWEEYVARLPKMTVREIVTNHPKIADTEITAGYVELKNSDELLDPTIKNWIHDYILHVGQERHPQMDRTQYLFHSENARELSSPDREKLGIILKSFDENAPLPVDEENEEIIFDEMVSEQRSTNREQQTVIGSQKPTTIAKSQPTPQSSFGKTTASEQESFIKPYPRTPQIQKSIPQVAAQQPTPALPPRQTSSLQSAPKPQPAANPAIDKFFAAPETQDIPSIKIQSITEHNEPRVAPLAPPRPNIQQPMLPRQTNTPPQPASIPRPQHRIINPFEPRIIEPRIDGNVVDLSSPEE